MPDRARIPSISRLIMRIARITFALATVAAVLLTRSAHADAVVAAAEPAVAAAPVAETAIAAVPDERARFSASFRFMGSHEEEAARLAAIDRGIDSLFFMIRGIARSRLSDGTKIDPWVNFSFDAEKIRVRVPTSSHVSPLNGAPIEVGSGDDRSKLIQRLAKGKVTQVFIAGEGRRMNEWALSPDARTLLLTVTVSSPKLTRPVVYKLTYTRTQ
ncbi:MAG: hypothetical protein JWO86_4187 [Myxococcaceae bacterium]|nr:hypothetical protein [Myxococcaceae bacterium]